MTNEENLEHNKKIVSEYNANMPIFYSPDPKWIIAVTADKKLIVNEDIEVSEAAKVVLDMVQDTIRQQQAEIEALKAKTLTDDEIQEIAHGFGAIGWMGEETYEFARAILRKAQEK